MSQTQNPVVGRPCLRTPIPEITVAAQYLDEAVSAHFSNQTRVAERLIDLANLPAIREWTESLWGKASPYVQYRSVVGAPSILEGAQYERLRMPSSALQQLLHLRDGYHCRFCGIPVARKQIRDRLRKLYPTVLPWGRTNLTQHAAFQAMWAQYDHVLPYARGGNSDLDNMVVTCAPCNFGRMNYILEEVGLADPRTREPIHSTWDGLERLIQNPT
jgi:hypothetical protein